MFKDIKGELLKDGDKIKDSNGKIFTLTRKNYGNLKSFFGEENRLCIDESPIEPTPDYVKQHQIEKIKD